jgi:hypothetical protein
MTTLLSLYLELERLMLVADTFDERAADFLRDAMDPIWQALSDEDRSLLDQRVVRVIHSFDGLRVPVSDQLYYKLDSAPPEMRPIPREPIKDWQRKVPA